MYTLQLSGRALIDMMTRFAFQPWHSAVEFRRYLYRFMQELPRIDNLAGVDRTPYNQYDSIILPLVKYLKARGVDFKYGRSSSYRIASLPLM